MPQIITLCGIQPEQTDIDFSYKYDGSIQLDAGDAKLLAFDLSKNHTIKTVKYAASSQYPPSYSRPCKRHSYVMYSHMDMDIYMCMHIHFLFAFAPKCSLSCQRPLTRLCSHARSLAYNSLNNETIQAIKDAAGCSINIDFKGNGD